MFVFLLHLLFDAEDVGDMTFELSADFQRNISER
jgi:hypothetical protein